MTTELQPREPREKSGKRNITIENSYWHFAKRYGNGNASAGIRKALYVVYKMQGPDTQEPPSGGA